MRKLIEKKWKHGTCHAYKVYACRCQPCCAAQSAYKKARYVPHPAPLKQEVPKPALTSWWTEAKPDGFTASVERDQLARMKVSTLGKGYTRPISTDELNR